MIGLKKKKNQKRERERERETHIENRTQKNKRDSR